MTTRSTHQSAQFAFASLLESPAPAPQVTDPSSTLPRNLIDAVPFYRRLIERHHAAMLAADLRQITKLREEADRLATKLGDATRDRLANADSPRHILDRETRAPEGQAPLWGQSSSFEIACHGMRARIEMEGIFSASVAAAPWMGFAAYAVSLDQPFLTETGYCSFRDLGRALRCGVTPETFATRIVAAFIMRDLNGRLVPIASRYRVLHGETAS